jgi:Transcription termination factor nusG
MSHENRVSDNLKAGWFVVQTNPQREQFASDQIADHEPYCPRFKAPTGRIKPLFTGYIFCVATSNWSPIKNAPGVRNLLMVGDTPARLPEAVILNWRAQERHGLVQLPDPPRFKAGEKLVVLRGTLTNRVVIHSGMSGKDREDVLIDMLGSMVKLSIKTDDLVSEAERDARNSLRKRRETLIRSRNISR